MNQAEEILDLDKPPAAASARAWGRRQALLVGGAVLGVVCALVAVLFWPDPRPDPTIIGLRDAPAPAWSMSRDELYVFPTTCGGDGILVIDRAVGQVVCRALDDGAQLWATVIDDASSLAGNEPVFVNALEGTDLIEVVAGAKVRLLASGNGEVRQVIERSLGAEGWIGSPPLFSSDQGTLFWVEPQDDPLLGGSARLSRLREPDPAAEVWSAGVGDEALNVAWADRAAIEHRGYVWLREPDWTSPSFSMAVGLEDGELPRWSLELRGLAFHGSTVIGSTGSGLEARDIGSNRQLWQRSVWGERAMAVGDGVYIVDGAETVVLNPETGRDDPAGRRVIAPVTRVDPRTGRELWRVELPHGFDQIKPIGHQLVAVRLAWMEDSELELSALNPVHGSVAWTRNLGAASSNGVFWGEGQVIVSYVVPDTVSGETQRLIALDSETGETRWDTELEGYAFVLGKRLLTVSDTLLQVYR